MALACSTLAWTGCTAAAGGQPSVIEAPVVAPTSELPTIAATVKSGAPFVLTGSSPTVIAYEVPEDIAVVATLDCADCTGGVSLSTNAARQPLLKAKKAPTYGEFLISLLRYERSGTVTVEASGAWTLTLASWKDTAKIAKLGATVKGSRVFQLPGKKEREYDVVFKPADKDDTFTIRTYPMPKTDTGKRVTLDKSTETPLVLPPAAVIAVTTRGKWSITEHVKPVV